MEKNDAVPVVFIYIYIIILYIVNLYQDVQNVLHQEVNVGMPIGWALRCQEHPLDGTKGKPFGTVGIICSTISLIRLHLSFFRINVLLSLANTFLARVMPLILRRW